jgi:hypothetical protein
VTSTVNTTKKWVVERYLGSLGLCVGAKEKKRNNNGSKNALRSHENMLKLEVNQKIIPFLFTHGCFKLQ